MGNRLNINAMRSLHTHSSIHGVCTVLVLILLTHFSAATNLGFWAVFLLCAVSCWYCPCYWQFVAGATIGLLLFGMWSFFLIEGSATLIAFPLIVITFASAFVFACLSAHLLRWLIARIL